MSIAKFFILGFSLLTSAAFASGKAPITTNHFTFKISSSAIKCQEGQLSGHFPLPTELRIITSYGSSSILYPNQFVLLNSPYADISSLDKTCADFSALTSRPPWELMDAIGTQELSESVGKNQFGVCIKEVREDLTLTIQGLEFHGASDFFITPLPKEACP